jgi:copper(I)-binding protein
MPAFILRLALLLSAIAPAWVQAGEPPPLQVERAWIRTAPPNAPVMAGYAWLRNASDAPLELAALRSPAFGAVELHEMRDVDGVMRMRPLRLKLAPDERTELAPGGTHLMLMRPTAPLAAGARVTIEFCFGDGTVQPVEFEVRADRPAGG